MRRSNFSYI